MRRLLLAILIPAILVIGIVALAGCSGNNIPQNAQTPIVKQTENNASIPNGVDTDKDSIPDNAEKVLGTDPLSSDTDGDGVNDKEDKNPVNVDTEPVKTTGTNDFSIKEILVENNYDSIAKKDAPDHLEILLINSGENDISKMDVFYSITDLKTNQKQSYLVPLNGFTLEKGSQKSVHIDTETGKNHFRANPNSLYYTSTDEMRIDVIVNAINHQAQERSVNKDAGGAEVAD